LSEAISAKPEATSSQDTASRKRSRTGQRQERSISAGRADPEAFDWGMEGRLALILEDAGGTAEHTE
jgi:hypothetical protein